MRYKRKYSWLLENNGTDEEKNKKIDEMREKTSSVFTNVYNELKKKYDGDICRLNILHVAKKFISAVSKDRVEFSDLLGDKFIEKIVSGSATVVDVLRELLFESYDLREAHSKFCGKLELSSILEELVQAVDEYVTSSNNKKNNDKKLQDNANYHRLVNVIGLSLLTLVSEYEKKGENCKKQVAAYMIGILNNKTVKIEIKDEKNPSESFISFFKTKGKEMIINAETMRRDVGFKLPVDYCSEKSVKEIEKIMDQIIDDLSVKVGLEVRTFSLNPKKLISWIWDSLIKRIYNYVKENKVKAAGIFGAIIATVIILKILSKKFPIIGKIFAPFVWLLKAPFRAIKWLISKFGKKQQPALGGETLDNISSNVGSETQQLSQQPMIMFIYEQYISNPTFRRAYDNFSRNLSTYFTMYSLV